jgi:hypothetical protein
MKNGKNGLGRLPEGRGFEPRCPLQFFQLIFYLLSRKFFVYLTFISLQKEEERVWQERNP